MNKKDFMNKIKDIQISYFGNTEDITALEDRNELSLFYDQITNTINNETMSNQQKIDYFTKEIIHIYENVK